MKNFHDVTARFTAAACTLLLCLPIFSSIAAIAEQSSPSLELSRSVRSWAFLPVVGTRAGLLGNESGQMEAWVYPLKIFRSFHLTFHVDGREWPAAVGGTFHFGDDPQHAFVFGEEQKKFSAIVGSPSASSPQVAYQTNYS